MSERELLIRELYLRDRTNFRDVRRYRTKRAIQKRLWQLEEEMETVAEEERTARSKLFRRMWVERRLLLIKSMLHRHVNPDDATQFDLRCALLRMKLEQSERDWYESETRQQKAERKEAHIIALLTFDLATQSDAELRSLLIPH
jgi:hypothetical protein